jgi:4-fold beta flower protein
MEKTLYDKKGEAVAYIAMDYRNAVFLWDGDAAAYLYEGGHVYGINGRHLGWFIDDILYDQDGTRIGFTSSTCPAAVGKTGPKGKRSILPELKPRWAAPPLPKLTFREAAQGLADFLREGLVI